MYRMDLEQLVDKVHEYKRQVRQARTLILRGYSLRHIARETPLLSRRQLRRMLQPLRKAHNLPHHAGRRGLNHLMRYCPAVLRQAMGLALSGRYAEASALVEPYLGYSPSALTWERWLAKITREGRSGTRSTPRR